MFDYVVIAATALQAYAAYKLKAPGEVMVVPDGFIENVRVIEPMKVNRCSYCGSVHQRERCPSCGAPRKK